MAETPDVEEGNPNTGFTEELAELQRRIDRFRSHPDPQAADAVDLLLADLQSAHEELRVADEEVRIQQHELERVVESHRLGRWQHERLVAVLPAPIIVTDGLGVIQTVNAAASALFRVPVDRLLRKPLQSFLAIDDRADLRRMLGHSLTRRGTFRQVLNLAPRRAAEPITVEAVATVTRGAGSTVGEVTWLLLAPRPVAGSPSVDRRTALARAVVELTRLPLHRESTEEVLNRLAGICERALGQDITVVITLQSGSAPTDVVHSADRGRDPRPPRRGQAEPTPVPGPITLDVRVGDDAFGVLQVSSAAGEIDATTVEAAELLATTVGAVLHEVEVKAELEVTALQLQTALRSRPTIDLAKGIIMAQRGCGPDEAFEHLVELSSNSNQKLRDVAAQLVDDVVAGRISY
jgi:PAS domain-containing protein